MPTVLTKHGPDGPTPLIVSVAAIGCEPLSGAAEVSLVAEGGAGSLTFLAASAEGLAQGEAFGLLILPLSECKALLAKPAEAEKPAEEAPAKKAAKPVAPTPIAPPTVTPPSAPIVPAVEPTPVPPAAPPVADPAKPADDAGAAS